MGDIREFLSAQWLELAIPLAVFVVVTCAGWMAKRTIFRRLGEWTARTSFQFDDLLLEAARKPYTLWVTIAGLYLAIEVSTFPSRFSAPVSKGLLILWVLSLTITTAAFASSLIRRYGERLRGALPVTSLTQSVATIVIAIAGALIILNLLGISIMPILTALGIGGLAVALALQDTLANLFAGISVSASGKIRRGDYIKLQSGEEGYVADICWRSTTIRSLANNLIIIPNGHLSQAIVTNYYLPEKRMSLLIPVSVSYDSDPVRVQEILVEEAKAGAREIPGLLSDPAPFVRFIPGFGDSSLDFTLICQVAEFTDQYLAQSELRTRIFQRFQREGIQIPFPIRTLYLRDVRGDGQAAIPAGSR